jgi:hypothetical protein
MDLVEVASRRKRLDKAALAAFEQDPVRIVEVARLIARFDVRVNDYGDLAFKRSRQRLVYAISRNELPSDAACTTVPRQEFCRWAEMTWGDQLWFARVRAIKNFGVGPSVGASSASIPMSVVQATGFQWVDDHAWLREQYRVSEAAGLQLQARVDELDSEARRFRDGKERVREQNRQNALGRNRKK